MHKWNTNGYLLYVKKHYNNMKTIEMHEPPTIQLPIITLMMTSNTKEEFLRRYNGKQVKEDRKEFDGEKGNPCQSCKEEDK